MRSSVRLLGVSLLCGVASMACNKEPRPAPEQSPAPALGAHADPAKSAPGDTAPGQPATGGVALPPAAASFSETHFTLTMKPTGTYKAGQAGAVQVVLEAKAPYHCNDKYPYKLKLEDTPGVQYPDKVVTSDAVKVEHTRATMTASFTPDAAGKKKISGRFMFSVCSEDKCLVEKRDLALDVDVM